VSSAKKLFNNGVYYHFLLVSLILTALKLVHESVQGVLNPTANKRMESHIAGLPLSYGLIDKPQFHTLPGGAGRDAGCD
jgi:hypothetical protein